MPSDEWTWEFRQRATDAFGELETDTQRRIVSKLDDIVSDEWRDPGDYVEPLIGAPHGKSVLGTIASGPTRRTRRRR